MNTTNNASEPTSSDVIVIEMTELYLLLKAKLEDSKLSSNDIDRIFQDMVTFICMEKNRPIGVDDLILSIKISMDIDYVYDLLIMVNKTVEYIINRIKSLVWMLPGVEQLVPITWTNNGSIFTPRMFCHLKEVIYEYR